MAKSPLTQYKGSLTEQYASGIFLRGLNDKLKLVFSLQFLPANVSKTRSSQQGESILLQWIAVWPEDDFNQGKGEYERVLQEEIWQSCQCLGFLVFLILSSPSRLLFPQLPGKLSKTEIVFLRCPRTSSVSFLLIICIQTPLSGYQGSF